MRSIKRWTAAGTAAILCMASTNQLQAATMDTGSSLGAPATGYEILIDQLVSEGITFSAEPATLLWYGSEGSIADYKLLIIGATGAPEVRIDFDFPVTKVSIDGVDDNPDSNTLELRAFDINDQEVAYDLQSGDATTGGVTASVSGLSIDYVTVEMPSSTILLENLELEGGIVQHLAIPEPTSAVACLGLFGSALMLRRRK